MTLILESAEYRLQLTETSKTVPSKSLCIHSDLHQPCISLFRYNKSHKEKDRGDADLRFLLVFI